jgi:hypothetical protein
MVGGVMVALTLALIDHGLTAASQQFASYNVLTEQLDVRYVTAASGCERCNPSSPRTITGVSQRVTATAGGGDVR